MRLIQCTQCHQHLFAVDANCSFCGAVVVGEAEASIRPSMGALLLGLLMGGCDDGDDGSVALYGVPVTDNDEDGWAAEDGDCDDNDASIHPDAEETPGDGVDSNCDGDDDT